MTVTLCHADAFGPNTSPGTDYNVNQIAEALAKVTQLQRLPQAKPDMSTGEENDTRFFIWETAFDALIDSAPVSTQQKLYLLYQYLDGKAKKVVEQLQYLVGANPDTAYSEARKKLKQRFGRSAIIATDFENKLAYWPKIASNDVQGIRDFSDFLQQVEIASAHLPSLKIFEYPSKLQTLVEKLPNWFSTKWSTIVQQQGCDSFPTFARIPNRPDIDIGLLIGRNVPAAFHPISVISGNAEEPWAEEYKFGWTVIGCVCKDKKDNDATVNTISVNRVTVERETLLEHESNATDHNNRPAVTSPFANPVLTKDITSSKQLRKICGTEQVESMEDRRFREVLSNGLHKNADGNWEVPLPFKSDNVTLPNNKKYCLRRLLSLKRNLMNNEKVKSDYLAFMQKNLDRGHASRVPVDQLTTTPGKVWYLPHFNVYHPRKPDQIRVVFDCSAVFDNESLNEHLLQGPDQLNSLIGVLTRFRKEEVAFTCDIEQMFHSFYLPTNSRESFRPTSIRAADAKSSTDPQVVLPPPGKFEPPDTYSRKRWRRVQYMANQFWLRWQKEYCNLLQKRQKWNSIKRNMKEGDAALLCNDELPRNQWPLALVTKTYPSQDKLVCKVEVATYRNGQRKNFDRPIHKLILLVPQEDY
ncbi:hypothetical protein QZH41_006276 [Actinostola sp. cb2023]|nr:hypothetical protein QZH41_006276 [Actinostola sp. cb2023]